MLSNSLIYQLVALVLAGTPLSLLILNYLQKFLNRNYQAVKNVKIICTDVVGTLTKNKLEVKSLKFDHYHAAVRDDNEFLDVINNKTKETLRVEKREFKKEKAVKLMAAITTLCHYPKHEKIESVLSRFFHQCNLFATQIQDKYEIIDVIPTSQTKKISTVVAMKKESEEIFSFSKGNPKNLIQRCTRILDQGQKIEITDNIRKKLLRRVKNMNKKGEKVIAFAYKGLPYKRYESYSSNFTETDLVLVGIVGLGNFINKDLIPYIEKLREEGIKFYILSKVRARKAIAIGEELNLINTNYFETIEKEDLEDLNDKKLSKLFANKEKDYIFSDLSKKDQERIFNLIKENGEKTVMLDNNDITLKNILEGLKRKRLSKLHSKQTYIHSATTKISTFLIVLFSILFQAPLPLSISIILILDLIFNILIEYSLNLEKHDKGNPSPEINQKKIAIKSLLSALIISAIYFWSLTRFGWFPGEHIPYGSQAYQISSTMVFILLIAQQISSAYKIREHHSLFSNPYLTLSALASILLTYTFITLELLTFADIPAYDWYLLAFVVIFFLALEKLIPYAIRKSPLSEDQSDTAQS